MNILGIIVIILLCFIIILLYLGIKIIINYEKKGSNFKGSFKVLILNHIIIFSKEYPSTIIEEKKEEEKKETVDYKPLLKESTTILTPLKILIINIKNAIEVNQLENHLKLGLPSYVDTAEYVGYIWAIFTIPNTLIKSCKLTAEPIFQEVTFDVCGKIDIKIKLIKIILPAINFLLTKEVREYIKLYFKLKNP